MLNIGYTARLILAHLALRFICWRLASGKAPAPFVIRDTQTGTVYLKRYDLARVFGRKLMAHIILQPDADRDMHDHPWNFLTLVLGGGYYEETNKPGDSIRWNPTGTIRVNRAGFAHRISSLPKGYAVTLVLRGRRSRDWGFLTRCGWQYWRDYIAKKKQGAPICED